MRSLFLDVFLFFVFLFFFVMDRSQTPPVPEKFTTEYFESFQDLNDVPKAYKKDPQERIFVTRDLNMHSIKYVGCMYFECTQHIF